MKIHGKVIYILLNFTIIFNQFIEPDKTKNMPSKYFFPKLHIAICYVGLGILF